MAGSRGERASILPGLPVWLKCIGEREGEKKDLVFHFKMQNKTKQHKSSEIEKNCVKKLVDFHINDRTQDKESACTVFVSSVLV